MDWRVTFPVSGVETWAFLPPLVAFVVSFFASMGGVAGAFLILPFQVSILHFVSPSVSSTNLVYNIVAIPSGVYRYMREGRMVWPLAWVLILGTLPGILIGYYIRVFWLPDPRAFKLFVAGVLLYIGARLLREVFAAPRRSGILRTNGGPKRGEQDNAGVWDGLRLAGDRMDRDARVKTVSWSMRRVDYEFCGERFSFEMPKMLILAFVVWIVGGAFGIGGGSVISPFCVSFFRLPVYTIAGAALLGTFLTSVAGVSFYSLLPLKSGVPTSPDWPLGILFGLGGFLGMYCGARLQKFVPQRLIKIMLGLLLVLLAADYIVEFFAGLGGGG